MERFRWATGRRGLIAVVLGVVGVLSGCGTSGSEPSGAAESPPAPEYLNTDPASASPYSDAVRVGSTLYLAGQLGLDDQGKIVPGGITAESDRMLQNLKATLERHGSSMERVVSCLVFLADINERDALNDVYKRYWKPGHFPARTAVGTSGLYAGARVEISCTAVTG
jgi:lysine/arginine/ornithine transport system substrate-binding protein